MHRYLPQERLEAIWRHMAQSTECVDRVGSQGINRSCLVYVGRRTSYVVFEQMVVTSGDVLKGIGCSQVVLIAATGT
jgi:hypothetical protein